MVFGVLVFCLMIMCTGQHAYAQKKKKNKQEKTVVASSKDSTKRVRKFILMGKYFGSSVVLRWAPKTAAAWQKADTAGYQLYRFEFNEQDKEMLNHPTQLTTEPIKPLTLGQWKQKFKPDDTAAAIAAEVLYGKKFTASVKKDGEMSWGDAYTAYVDMDNRLGYALLNADVHPDIAGGMGWRWEDKTAAPGKMYFYVLISPALNTQPADTATVLISTKQQYKTPEMIDVVAMPWDKTITIYWSRSVARHFFSCYYIERSDDKGKTFHRVNKLPFINTSNTARKNNKEEWINYVDSIPQNYTSYTYRVRGVTAFGELSAPSKPVTAAGLDKTGPGSPLNVRAENIKGSQVKISWQKSDIEKDFAGYMVGRSNSPNGPFYPLDTVLLSAKAQNYIDQHAATWDKNFYIVAAIDTAGNAVRSMPAYAIIKDSVAPVAPAGLTGAIDSNGIVHLHWHLNKELDLEGYNVYASNNPAHTFYVLNSSHIADTSFVDSLTLKTLTRHIYYRICAYDKSGNPSAYSKVLALIKPDIIPPVPPVFNHFNITDSSVTLQWIPSTSEDAAKQIIWRREKDSLAWRLLDTLSKTVSVYTDKKIVRLKEYDYSLTAIDSSGLSSEHSFPLHARIYDNGKRKEIDNLKLTVTGNRSIQLAWSYAPADRQHIHFIIYRNYNDGGLAMYRNVTGDKNEFTDTTLPGEGNYQYAVKVITDDGGSSKLTASQTIKYERKSGSQ